MTPLEAVLEGRWPGVRIRRLGDERELFRIKVTGGSPRNRAWLRSERDKDEIAFVVAVGLVSAVERGGGDPERLRAVAEIHVSGIQ